MFSRLLTGLFAILVIVSCQGNQESTETSELADAQQPYEAFFDALAVHCGNAYQGGLTTAPPGDDMITFEDILVVHFRECEDNVLKVPFHIQTVADGEWNRSRTWISPSMKTDSSFVTIIVSRMEAKTKSRCMVDFSMVRTKLVCRSSSLSHAPKSLVYSGDGALKLSLTSATPTEPCVATNGVGE